MEAKAENLRKAVPPEPVRRNWDQQQLKFNGKVAAHTATRSLACAGRRRLMNTHVKIRLGVSLVMLVSTSFALMAQTAGQRLKEALDLEKDGKPALAIAQARALLDSNSLDPYETGKAWNILGLAYEDEGDLQLARHADEESIRILEPVPNIRDYAMALDDLGGVY